MACNLEAGHWNVTRIHKENLKSHGNELYTGITAYKANLVDFSQQNNASPEQMQQSQGALFVIFGAVF